MRILQKSSLAGTWYLARDGSIQFYYVAEWLQHGQGCDSWTPPALPSIRISKRGGATDGSGSYLR